MTKIIESLKEIGFNSYEAKVYLALLKKHPATGYEVSKLADVPQSRTYDTLNVLAQKGIVISSQDKPVTYTPVQPKELTKKYRKKVTQNLDFLEKHLPEIKEQTQKPITTITDENNIKSTIVDLIKSAKKEIYIEAWAQDLKLLEKELLDAYNRNVEIRIVSYEKTNLNFGLVYEHPFAKRIETSLQGRMIALVCDKDEAVYGKLFAHNNSEGYIIHTQNEIMTYLIKDYIIHDLILLDIQTTFPKELISEYGAGLKRLHDKMLGPDNIFKIVK